MIVKVQMSQFSSDGEQRLLIYNRDRSFLDHLVVTDKLRPLVQRLSGRPKVYFEATLDADRNVELGREVELQRW